MITKEIQILEHGEEKIGITSSVGIRGKTHMIAITDIHDADEHKILWDLQNSYVNPDGFYRIVKGDHDNTLYIYFAGACDEVIGPRPTNTACCEILTERLKTAVAECELTSVLRYVKPYTPKENPDER